MTEHAEGTATTQGCYLFPWARKHELHYTASAVKQSYPQCDVFTK